MIKRAFFFLVIVLVFLSGCISENGPAGTIQFTSSPTGAQVYLDAQFRGSTPTSITGISPGNHTLELRYPGYQSWSAVMAVSPGPNNVFAALLPVQGGASPGGIPVTQPIATTPAPGVVTVKASREQMTIGESMGFSGKGEGYNQVLLTMYGPGDYTKGKDLPRPDVNALGTWGYTWNPGSSLLPGTYTMEVSSPWKDVTDRVEFKVVGGGQVSITTSNYSPAKGDTIVFSGLCTTGARNVRLMLSGPDVYSGGVDLGIFPVQADTNWNFRYTIDNTMPTGFYTATIYDVPQTASSNVQFSVGFG